MEYYRLKKEAVPFFNEKHASKIYTFDLWESLQVDPIALEKVEDAYLTYGHMNKDRGTGSLCGWDDTGSRFHFTIYFPSSDLSEHDKFSKGKVVRNLMDKIQQVCNSFYREFEISPETK